MRLILMTLIGGLSLLLTSNLWSCVMAQTKFIRGVGGPYSLRTAGEPRLRKQSGQPIGLSPARQRQLLKDLKEIGFQGDFMVTSDFRKFPELFRIFNKRIKTYDFDDLIDAHPGVENLIESLAMRIKMDKYREGADSDNPAQHSEYDNENLPKIWKPANWITELKKGLKDEGLSNNQISVWVGKMKELRKSFGGFGSKHMKGGKVDIYQNMLHRPGGAEMLEKLQEKGYYFYPEKMKDTGSYIWDVSFPGVSSKKSSYDFKNPRTQGLVLGYRPWADSKVEKRRVKEETTSPGISGIDVSSEEEVIEKAPVSKSKKSFDQAFREARASGLRQFMWTNKDPSSRLFGKTYPVLTRVAGESEEEWNRKFPPVEIEEKEEERIVEKKKVQPDPQLVPEEIKKEPVDESVFEMKEESEFEAPPAPEMPPERVPLDVPKPYGVFAKETPEFQEAEKEQLWEGKHGGEVKKYWNGGEAAQQEVVEKEEEVDMNWEETDLPPYDFDSGVKKSITDKPLTPEELGKKPEEEPKSFEEQEMETKQMSELKSFFDEGHTDILWQYKSDELQDLRDKHVGVGSSDRDRLNDLIVKKKEYEEKLGSYAPGEGRQGQIPSGSFQFESKVTESEDVQPKKGQYHKGVFYPDYEEKKEEEAGISHKFFKDPTPTKGVPRLPKQEVPKPAPRVMPSKSPQEQKQEKDEFQVEQERLNQLQQQKMTDVENTLRATDPNRYWNNLGTAGKINAGLAMIFGLASPDGRNAGVEAIKKSINEDIAQQKLEHDVEIAKKKIALETVTKKIDNMMKFRKDQTLNVKTKLESDKLKAEIAKLDMEGKAETRLNTKRALVMAGKIPFDSLSYADKTAMLGKKGMDQFSDLYTKYNKSSEKVQIGMAINTLGSIREYARMQDGIGDTAILFRVLKLLDPNSVVREGEFANAQKSGVSGVEQIKRVYDRLVTAGGPSLTPAQRERWSRVALTQAKQVKNQHDVINKRFDKHAKALGLPTVTTTYNLFEQDPVARKRYKMFVKIKKANPQFRNKEILDAMKRKGIPLL